MPEGHIKILHIEDDRGSADVVRAVLSSAPGISFDLEWTDRLDKGLERLAKGGVDVVLLDLGLPDSHGLDTFHRTRASDPQVAIIVFTVTDDEELAIRAVHEGAQDYLSKGLIQGPAGRLLLTRAIRYAVERRHVQETLAEERRLLRNLIDSFPDHIYVKDTESRFLMVNLVTARFLGRETPEQVIGKTDFDFFPHGLAMQFRAEEEAVLNSTHALMNREVAVTDSTGKTRWVLTNKVPLRDSRGKVIALLGVNRDITEMKEAEMERTRLAGNLRSMLESTAVGFFGMDRAGRFTFINKAGARMLGYEPAELEGKDVHQTIHHKRSDGSRYPVEECPMNKAIRTGEGADVDTEVLWRRSGTAFPTEYTAFPVKENDVIQGAVVTFLDTTQRRAAEMALDSERNLLRALIDNLPDYILVKDMQGRYLVDNLAHHRFVGAKTPEEVIGKTPADFYPPAEAERIQAEDLEVMRTGQPMLNHEELMTRPDGQRVWVWKTKVPLREAGGEVSGLVAIVSDVTEHKAAEQRLAAQHAVTRVLAEAPTLDEATPKILQALCEGLGWDFGELWIPDWHQNVLHCIKTWHAPDRDLHEFDAATSETFLSPGVGVPGRVWSSAKPAWIPDITHDSNFPSARFAAKAGLRGALGFPIVLGQLVLGVVAFCSREIREPDHHLLQMFSVIGSQIGQFIERKQAEEQLKRTLTDLTKAHEELKATQAQLLEVEKMETVGRLAAGVAHEVKNPLAIIRMGVDFAMTQLKGQDGDLVQVLNDVNGAIQRATNIVNGLLDLSAAQELTLKPSDPNALLEQCLSMLRHATATAHVQVVRDYAEKLPLLKIDPQKIEQVFLNIVLNAIHAMPDGGTLTVRTYTRRLKPGDVNRDPGSRSGVRLRSGDLAVVIEVDDTGSGIPEDKLAKVFDPFFTTKPTGKGTGLGLTVSRRIVNMHGGTIQIQNRPEGGARATILLKV
ncbi:MAG: PAS domain-containing protein [Verrucomicrobia bacterium]|nr:PAS domain-containing protein [Verrucomicrobiota bacterium]